jgi:LytS/YehU family sensor histidine kinase
MTLPKLNRFRLAPMWRIYVLAWLAYTTLICFAEQLDKLLNGTFDPARAVMVAASMLPAALLLSLAWPLTGYLERRRHRLPAVLASHAAASVAFTLLSQVVFWIILKPLGKELNWYVWPFLYSMMMYIVGAGIFQLVRASQAAQRQALAMHEAQSLLIASELSALRSKLNPHFLFNTLHSIIALTRKDPRAAETALFKFSDMLRYVLDTEKSGKDRVTLDEELAFVRDYLALEALRLGERLSVEWDIDQHAAGCSVPALTLQPLVENSIKHAFNPRTRPGRLLIRTRLDAAGGLLRLGVRDDGPGADAAGVRQTNGLGIRTVERRLQLGYGEHAGFEIQTAPGAGFDVSLSIPLPFHERAA